MKKIALVIGSSLLVIAVICLPVIGFKALQMRASHRLLGYMEDVRPGMTISELAKIHDDIQLLTEDEEGMFRNGPIQDRSFCKGKKLYRFGYVTPTCRMVAVYTDDQDRVVYVTWVQL